MGPMAKGSLRGSIFTLMSAAIGSGVLLLPYAFKLVGVPLGMLCIACGTYCVAQSLRLILTIAHLTGCDSYTSSVVAVLGPTAGSVVACVTVGGSTCGTAAYLKILAELLPRVCPWVFQGLAPLQRMGVVLAMAFVPSVSRDISALERFTIISPLSLVCVAALIVGGASHSAPSGEGPGALAALDRMRRGDVGLRALPQVWSLVLNSLVCHHVAVPVYRKLHSAHAQRINKVVLRSVSCLAFLYAMVGICGLLRFGAATPENVLLAYPEGDRPALLAQALVGCSLLIAVPLNLHPARDQVRELLPGKAAGHLDRMPGGHALLTGVLLIVPAAMAVVIPSVTSIVGIMAGFGMVVWVFVIPIVVICRLRSQAESRRRLGGSGSFTDRLLTSPLATPLLSPRDGGTVGVVYPRRRSLEAEAGAALELEQLGASPGGEPLRRQTTEDCEWSPQFYVSLLAMAAASLLAVVAACQSAAGMLFAAGEDA